MFYPVKNTFYKNAEKPMAAGISAFGFSGTNAHVIVEEYKNEIKRIERR